jgi:coenzyme F420-reducing hydrogenase beta subunit
MKSFILGSSHVIRLKTYIRTHEVQLARHQLKIQCVNGGIVSSLFRYLVDINKFQPYVVVLQIGSSDVGNIEHYVEKV